MHAQLPIVPSQLLPRYDSMVVTVQGRTLGYQTSRLVRTDNGLLVTDHLSLGAFAEQQTAIQLDKDGRIRWVQQGGVVQGITIRTSLEYRRNRVRGVTVVPTPGGGLTVATDTTIPAGTIDDNAIPLFLPALPWGAGAHWSFPDFLTTNDTIRKVPVDSIRLMTLTVTGPATVSLPTGPVETWQAELLGGPAPVLYFVTKLPPHRLVRMEIVGAGLQFMLVN